MRLLRAFLSILKRKERYTCDACGRSFPKGWTDEEAEAEYKETFARLPPEEPRALVCDDCYNEIMGVGAC